MDKTILPDPDNPVIAHLHELLMKHKLHGP